MNAAVIPEPIAQLQLQLDQIRSTQPRGKKLPDSVWQAAVSYDGQGYWLAQKRLSRGKFVWWPEGSGAAKPLEAYEAQFLMAVGDVSRSGEARALGFRAHDSHSMRFPILSLTFILGWRVLPPARRPEPAFGRTE
jgi:hypothetical protein